MRALLIVDHGSRNEAANEQLAHIAELVRTHVGERRMTVAHAHLELAAPSIPDAIATLVADGATEIIVHPYFLAPGRHATTDIPKLAHDAATRHPNVVIRVTAPLGIDPLLAELVMMRVDQCTK